MFDARLTGAPLVSHITPTYNNIFFHILIMILYDLGANLVIMFGRQNKPVNSKVMESFKVQP